MNVQTEYVNYNHYDVENDQGSRNEYDNNYGPNHLQNVGEELTSNNGQEQNAQRNRHVSRYDSNDYALPDGAESDAASNCNIEPSSNTSTSSTRSSDITIRCSKQNLVIFCTVIAIILIAAVGGVCFHLTSEQPIKMIGPNSTQETITKFQFIVTSSCQDTLITEERLIHSPNYPSAYNLNDSCDWKLVGPKGRQLEFHVNEFRTEQNADTLYVYDGPNADSPRIGNFSGSSFSQDMITSTNTLYLQFRSDNMINYPGFALQYSLNMPAGFITVNNRGCKTTSGAYYTLKSAIAHCQSDQLCSIYDNECNDEGKYQLCKQGKGVAHSQDGSCVYIRGERLGVHEDWTYYKLKVTGRMTSENVRQACFEHGLIAPCYCSECKYNDLACNVTIPKNFININEQISKSICPRSNNAKKCKALEKVFHYMANYDVGSSHGLYSETYVSSKPYSNLWALCAKNA